MLKAIMMTGALIVSAPAMAQMRPGHGDWLENADTNKDGMIDKDEFKARRAAHFEKLDRNSDGFLDQQDRPQRATDAQAGRAGGDRGAGMVAQLDADGDGKVSKDEYATAPTTFFDRVDTDHDGVLKATEIEAAKSAARTRFNERRKR